jgi:hypothetical protein
VKTLELTKEKNSGSIISAMDHKTMLFFMKVSTPEVKRNLQILPILFQKFVVFSSFVVKEGIRLPYNFDMYV